MIAKGSDMNVNLTIFIIIFTTIILAIVNRVGLTTISKNFQKPSILHSRTTESYQAPGGAQPYY